MVVLSAALLVAPSATAAAQDAGSEELGWPDRVGRDGAVTVATTDDGVPLAPAVTAGGSAFHDPCGDPVERTPDLRRATLRHDREAGVLGLRIEACSVLDPVTTTGALSLHLYDRDGLTHAVDLVSDSERFHGQVLRTKTGRITPLGPAEVSADGFAVELAIPTSAIGRPDRFAFEVVSHDAWYRPGDLLPDAGRDLLVWPDGACDGGQDLRSVVVEPGQLERAVAAAVEVGLHPQAVVAGGDRFQVRLAPGDTDDAVAALAGVRHVTDTTVYPAPEVTDTGTGSGSTDDGAATEDGASTVDEVVVTHGEAAWWRTAVRAPAAADPGGRGIVVGVIDDGLDGSRPEFGRRIAAGRDALTGQRLPAGVSSDLGGHGTGVAGVLAARSGTVLGVAPDVTVRPYRVFDEGGCGTDLTVAAGIEHAIADEVDVINLSLGGPGPTSPIIARALDAAAKAGTVVIVAAGNAGEVGLPQSPGDHPTTLAVGATTADTTLARYSNRGRWLDLVAPGGDGSRDPARGLLTLGERGGYRVMNGTSLSSPLVAASAALYLERWPDAVPSTVRDALTSTATDLGAPGRDDAFGWGLLRIPAAVATEPPPALRDLDAACGGAPPVTFTDVDGVHQASVACVGWWGVAAGVSVESFRPAASVTRGQFSTFVDRTVRALGVPLADADVTFPDAVGHTHAGAIARLAAAGMVGGFEDGTFRPDEPVSRAQMATFLVRAIEVVTGRPVPAGVDRFPDDDGLSHEGNIDRLADQRITVGDADGNYRPHDPVTRAGMATFLARVLTLGVEAGAPGRPA